MKIHLLREPSTLVCTPGVLFVNGRYECFMLEDVIREQLGVPVEKWKIAGATAIPSGIYRVEITRSPKYSLRATQKAGKPVDVFTPQIMGVPGFTGIRMHPGVRADDTEGCPLPGRLRLDVDPTVEGIEELRESKLAYDPLFAKIKEACDIGEDVTIEVRNGFDLALYSPLPA